MHLYFKIKMTLRFKIKTMINFMYSHEYHLLSQRQKNPCETSDITILWHVSVWSWEQTFLILALLCNQSQKVTTHTNVMHGDNCIMQRLGLEAKHMGLLEDLNVG